MIEPINYSCTITKTEGGHRYSNSYGTWELGELELQEIPPDKVENIDKWGGIKPLTLDEQIANMKTKFAAGSLQYYPKTQDIWKNISDQADSAIGKFMDGTLSEEELSSTFQTLAHDLFESTAKVGYPIPLLAPYQEQACTEAVYDEFRAKILSIAVQRNNNEGKQYITGELTAMRKYKYYNADYYYKSEAAIAAVTKGMDEFVQERGWDYTMPDYKGQKSNLYYNFNTAFSNNFCVEEQYLLDPDMKPPEGFEWFFETGGKYRSTVTPDSLTIKHQDGSRDTYVYKTRDKFDPDDFYTGTTWAAYIDENGNRQVVSKDIIFHDEKSDLMNVGDLLNFGSEKKHDFANQFLKNLQLYPMSYFSRIVNCNMFDCTV